MHAKLVQKSAGGPPMTLPPQKLYSQGSAGAPQVLTGGLVGAAGAAGTWVVGARVTGLGVGVDTGVRVGVRVEIRVGLGVGVAETAGLVGEVDGVPAASSQGLPDRADARHERKRFADAPALGPVAPGAPYTRAEATATPAPALRPARAKGSARGPAVKVWSSRWGKAMSSTLVPVAWMLPHWS